MNKPIFLLLFCMLSSAIGARQNIENKTWKSIVRNMPDEWYGTTQAIQIADTLVKYQTVQGGWPKNVKWHYSINRDEMREIRRTGIGATIDNNATIYEMYYLAHVYSRAREQRHRDAFIKGVNYLLEAQYDNGGWPQFYPVRKAKGGHYSAHITYNDGAIQNVMILLREIFEDAPKFAALALNDTIKQQVRRAFDRGIDCILKTQIIVDGVPTVWCAQHDAQTLQPAGARAYELASFSGSESVGIVYLLMSLPNPSPEIVRAVKGAAKWFDDHKIEGYRYARAGDKAAKVSDACLVEDKGGAVWARFYDLDTGRPFFCDRDGIKRNSIEEVGRERRNGYGWYTDAPAQMLKTYREWLEKH